jgi:hypothetical protein
MLTAEDITNAIMNKYLHESCKNKYFSNPKKYQKLMDRIVQAAIDAVEKFED